MRLIYSTYGRIVHGWIGVDGSHVMDDFGNSIRTNNNQVTFFIRGSK